MLTSAIKQAVSTRRGDARKSAAEEKASTVWPKDLMSIRMDSRKNTSSSTTETNNARGMRPPGARSPAPYGRVQRRSAPSCNLHLRAWQEQCHGCVNLGLCRGGGFRAYNPGVLTAEPMPETHILGIL